MPLKRLCYIFFLYFLVADFSALAQQTKMPVVTGDFKNLTAEQFLLQLEKQTEFHFYFDTSQLNSVMVNISVSDQVLPDVLKLAFANTSIGFSYDTQDDVFISKGQVVQTELPAGFFGQNRDRNNYISADSIVDYLNAGSKVKNSTQPNKLYTIGEQGSSNNQSQFTITGFLLDNKTGEPVIGASVHVENTSMGVITDQYGYYTISLPKGRHTLSIQSIGMKDTKREIQVYGDGKFNIEMQTQIIALKRVIVSAEKASKFKWVCKG